MQGTHHVVTVPPRYLRVGRGGAACRTIGKNCNPLPRSSTICDSLNCERADMLERLVEGGAYAGSISPSLPTNMSQILCQTTKTPPPPETPLSHSWCSSGVGHVRHHHSWIRNYSIAPLASGAINASLFINVCHASIIYSHSVSE